MTMFTSKMRSMTSKRWLELAFLISRWILDSFLHSHNHHHFYDYLLIHNTTIINISIITTFNINNTNIIIMIIINIIIIIIITIINIIVIMIIMIGQSSLHEECKGCCNCLSCGVEAIQSCFLGEATCFMVYDMIMIRWCNLKRWFMFSLIRMMYT